jgi:hypothetical protein
MKKMNVGEWRKIAKDAWKLILKENRVIRRP